MDLNAALIASLAAGLLSLILSYVPGLSGKFAALSSEVKSAIVAGSVIAIGVIVALSSCGGLWVFISCDKPGFMKLAECVLAALITNQSIYKLSPETPEVKAAKATR